MKEGGRLEEGVVSNKNSYLRNYGIGWHAQKEQDEQSLLATNQPFSAICLCSDDSDPSKIGLDRNVYDPGLCCIKPSEDKRTLNSCSGTIP